MPAHATAADRPDRSAEARAPGTSTITIRTPEFRGREVIFRWSVEPATPLYRRTQFSLSFPPEIDLDRVSPALWWRLALLCLHSHWTLLRPCVVVLPITLSPGETEFWLRLLDSEIATLESTVRRWGGERQIVLREGGRRLSPDPVVSDSGRWAAAFSSGKDSLTQAAMLREVAGEVVLVNVRSLLPGLWENDTPRRRTVLAEIERTPGFRLVQVESDFRSAWDNHFAVGHGYPLGVNEVTDTLLYSAVLFAVAAALDIPHVCLAVEAEVFENAEVDGVTIQYEQFMQAGGTVQALAGLFGEFGFRYSSAIAPLDNCWVLSVLWRRYRELAPLQHSCWEADADGTPCSACVKCWSSVLSMLATGHAPSEIGMDTANAIESMDAKWQMMARDDFEAPLLPIDRARIRRDGPRNAVLQTTSTGKLVWTLAAKEPGTLLRPRGWRAVLAYRRLRRRFAAKPNGPVGFHRALLDFVDPAIRDAVETIAAPYAQVDPLEGGEFDQRAVVSRATEVGRWILAPLAGERAAVDDPGSGTGEPPGDRYVTSGVPLTQR